MNKCSELDKTNGPLGIYGKEKKREGQAGFCFGKILEQGPSQAPKAAFFVWLDFESFRVCPVAQVLYSLGVGSADTII